jgi:hypothetical protein
VPYFERLGIRVEVFPPERISSFDPEADSRVVNEFNQTEIESLGDDIIKSIAAANAINDMRTIFLIHDKRFLAVLCDKTFLSAALEEEEISHLLPYLVPTYTSVQHPEIWEQAKAGKDGWVIKNALLGKSEQVYTGRTSARREWESLFSGSVRGNMVLQPYINQKRINSSIGDRRYSDYVTGTMLCFDNRFFGAGIFRTSSFEITNRIDDRKMCPCFTDDYAGFENCYIL